MMVTIVGVGALGSHLVQFLRSEKVDLRVIDFDRVEQKNVLSQFHGKPGVGKNKVESLRQTMDFLFKRKIEIVPHKLTTDNVAALLGASSPESSPAPFSAHLVIDCLDNSASRKLIQEHVRKLGIPCLHGALAPGGTFGRVIWDEGFTIDDEAGMGAATCEDGEFLPFIALVAAYLARAAQEFVASGKKVGYSVSPAGAFRI
jgi:molybdopterin/thiamine biosynthesis adenylyltransferase